jgi:hypothetical protein
MLETEEFNMVVKKQMTVHSVIFIIYALLVDHRFRLLKKDRGCIKREVHTVFFLLIAVNKKGDCSSFDKITWIEYDPLSMLF